MPIAGPIINWLHGNGRVAQVFIVVSGYLLAGSMSHRSWDRQRASRFIAQRYCRLAVPYLAAAALAIVACAFGRDWIEDDVIGGLPTIEQVLAHVVLLQDVLGYESLSAGFWFVCISFQLTVVYLGGLYLRDAIANRLSPWVRAALPIALGWLLAAASLFYFNRDSSWENSAVYYFGQFFLGVLVYHALKNRRSQVSFAVYVAIMAIALAFEWRSRLALALGTGVVLFAGGKIGLVTRWPTNRVVAFLGRISYSLFLIHFPVLVVVATLWMQQEWTSPEAAVAGLVFAFVVSIAAATLFYRYVEEPAMRLSRKFA
jgi:peptidoglycan/LPS O-acetylase OafA/YrhL